MSARIRAVDAAPLPPGATIGILGGGQLGRMLILAAARLGYRAHVYCPDADAPAVQVTDRATIAAYEDAAALGAFAQAVDVATYEFENIPAETAAAVAEHTLLRPGAAVLDICQDRIKEKRFLRGIGVATTEFVAVDPAGGFSAAFVAAGERRVLKSARLGYDGKAQATIDGDTDINTVWEKIASVSPDGRCILESWVDFAKELSVIVARSQAGATAAFDTAENEHANHVLKRTVAPARVSGEIAHEAEAIARWIAEEIGLIGVLAVEMFLTHGGRLLVNELAPRPHNSGHWTIDACSCSQFEQCVRAITGLPLAPTERHADAIMENLLGSDVDRWRDLAGEPGARLHLYGKNDVQPGRKMGHVTRLFPPGALARDQRDDRALLC